jgi:hypothetical protein
MNEIHVAMILAIAAIIIAYRRQPRLPSHCLEWESIAAENVHTEFLTIKGPPGKGRGDLTVSVDEDGKSVIAFPRDVIDGETWQVSLRCGRGQGGFRVEFILDPPDGGRHQFLAFGFSPSGAVVESTPESKLGPSVAIFDEDDEVIAQFPSR